MKRLILVLTVALVMTAMVVATAMPAFAGGGAIKFGYGPCGDFCSQSSVTPSENINQHQASHPNP